MKKQIQGTKKRDTLGPIRVSEISKFFYHSTRLKLVHGSILSWFDYCNSLYIGLSDSELHLLQMILNSAARVVRRLPRFSREHITPIRIDLHFLPIKARIKYKICPLAVKALKIGQPIHIRKLLTFKNLETNMNLETLFFNSWRSLFCRNL